MKLGEWVLIYFPAEDSGKQVKLLCPWQGPYRIVAKDETNIIATGVYIYFPDEESIKIHQSQVQMHPFNFPASYWYRKKQISPCHPSKWLEQLLSTSRTVDEPNGDASID